MTQALDPRQMMAALQQQNQQGLAHIAAEAQDRNGGQDRPERNGASARRAPYGIGDRGSPAPAGPGRGADHPTSRPTWTAAGGADPVGDGGRQSRSAGSGPG